MFTLRFDMRAPDGGAPATDLYAAAIEMCSWAETRGAAIAVLSEHMAPTTGTCRRRTSSVAVFRPDVACPYLECAVMAAEHV
jgi:hypothetical protein